VKFDLRTLAEATGGFIAREAQGSGPVWTDTRTLPEGAWFLAIRGPNFDGHSYVQQALEKGAIGAIVDTVDAAWEGGILRVPDTIAALQDLGRFARSRFGGPVVGLTGSSGKTTTRALTTLALSPLGTIHQTVGNLNNHLGVPMTLCAVPPEADAMVVEIGTSGPGEIEFLARMAEPDIRIVINVGPAHLEELGGLDGVQFEKGAMFRTAQPGDIAVYNVDDPRVRAMDVPDGVRTLGAGRAEDADIRLVSARPSAANLSMRCVYDTPEGRVGGILPVMGDHFAIDAGLALAAAWAAGADLKDAMAALAGYQPVGMRMRAQTTRDGVRIFNDAYNANPASMKASLDAFSGVPGRRCAVLGDMLELGPTEDDYHAETVAHAISTGLARILLVGERMQRAASSDVVVNALSLAGDAAPELSAHTDRDEAADALSAWASQGDQVLVKGSRGARAEAVLARLLERDAQENG
jgi:UDP-N-acetylmuramoyl-tripeptide--D-alanyl-D-alanine ligase